MSARAQLASWLALVAFAMVAAAGPNPNQFIGWTNFQQFTCRTNASGEVEWLSPRVPVRPANELIPTWNVELSSAGAMRLEVRAFHDGQPTKFYSFGQWTSRTNAGSRASVKGQGNAAGDVDTDTLQLLQPAEAFQFRVTFDAASNLIRFKRLGAVVTHTGLVAEPRAPLKSAWGRTLDVPKLSQLNYADGKAWCSPTTVTMLLQFWSQRLGRTDLFSDVPEVAWSIHDETWKGTGNWSYNMAYVGSQRGMVGMVTRFNDLRELELWTAKGYPVGVSLCYNRLRARGPGPNGHLMVCVGFDKRGDVILNDPGTRRSMQQSWPRERFLLAWAHSRHAVYLVYPEGAALPEDADGDWTPAP